MNEAFDSWADLVLDAISRSARFEPVLPSTNPGQISLIHLTAPDCGYEDFSLAMTASVNSASTASAEATFTSLPMQTLSEIAAPPPVSPSSLGPTSLVPLTRPGSDWMIDLDRGVLYGYDADRRQGIFAAKGAPPEWEWGAPFRPQFHWAALNSEDALLHAAVVGTPHAALLLVGPGGTGKSTTAFAAVERGLKTCGDDYVWLSRDETGLVAYSIYGTAKVKRASVITPPISMTASKWRDSPELGKRAYYVSLDRPHVFMHSARIVGAVALEKSSSQQPHVTKIPAHELARVALPSSVLQAPSHHKTLLARLSKFFRHCRRID